MSSTVEQSTMYNSKQHTHINTYKSVGRDLYILNEVLLLQLHLVVAASQQIFRKCKMEHGFMEGYPEECVLPTTAHGTTTIHTIDLMTKLYDYSVTNTEASMQLAIRRIMHCKESVCEHRKRMQNRSFLQSFRVNTKQIRLPHPTQQ